MAANGTSGVTPAIPDHVLLRRIGKGSYGEIWLARCALGVYRAVKVVYRHTFADTRPYEREFSGIKRFEPISREHEGLVDILQVGRNDEAGFFYYVMELADHAGEQWSGARKCGSDGKVARPQQSSSPASTPPLYHHIDSYAPRTLAYEIKLRGRLPGQEALNMSVALAQAMRYLHSRGLVHRDLKPSNIIFVGGQPKLADVGLVAELGDPQSFVGTEGFIAPEGPGTAQADIFSLGKVIYETLTGKDRQEFPELPTRLGSDGDESRFAELNEVILKACAKEPRDRYQSAGEMLDDLEILQRGKSLRLRRMRRQKFRYLLGAAAVILVGGIAAGLVWGVKHSASREVQQTKGDAIITDSFHSLVINTQLWLWSHQEWPGLSNSGYWQCRVRQTNSELVIESKTEHESGETRSGACWVDTKTNLLKLGECRVEIELSGIVAGGHIALSISDGQVPMDTEDSNSVLLVDLHGGKKGQSITWIHQRVRVDLFPRCQAAVVYPDAAIQEQFEILDLARLSTWRLRFYTVATTSAGFGQSACGFGIRKFAITKDVDPRTVLGSALDAISKRPVADAIIKDETGARLAQTLTSGAFKLAAKPGPMRIRAHHEDFSPSEEKLILGNGVERGSVNILLHRLSFGFGDVVETIPYPEHAALRSIGFWNTKLWALAFVDRGFALLPVDLTSKQVLPSGIRLSMPELHAFAECQDRLVGIRAWHGNGGRKVRRVAVQ